MELKKGPLSVYSLIFGSLKTANDAFGAVLAVFIFVGVLLALVWAVFFGALWVFGGNMMWLQLIIGPLQGFAGVVITMAIIQMVGAKMEKSGLQVVDSVLTSIIPAFYFIVSSVLLAIPVVMVLLATMFLHSQLITGIVMVGLLFVLLPFIFVQSILALREEGPISALQYSWRLGTAHYGRVLLTVITVWALILIGVLACSCLLKAWLPHLFSRPELFITNPQMAQMQLMQWFMSMPKLYLILGVFVFMIMYGYFLLVLTSIITGLFLNLDYCHRAVDSREFGMARAIPAIPPMAITPEIEVKQASVQTHVDEQISQHLDQVYSAKDHTSQIQHLEEDRMPTILFDDDLARQLAENERKMQEQKERAAKRDEDEKNQSQGSVKISGDKL